MTFTDTLPIKRKRAAPTFVIPPWWTERRCASLRTLWNIGYTASEIAGELGCTRDAVIGKAHRMKLTPRRSPIKRAA